MMNNNLYIQHQQNIKITKLISNVEDNNWKSDRNKDLSYEGLGEELLFGETHDNLFLGSKDNETLIGGEGNDTLIGELGDDILTGGGGADVFVINNPDEGLDVITDFDALIDLIQISGDGFEIDISETELSTKLNFDSSTGTLSYEGKDFLVVKLDGSLDIASNIELF